MNLGQGRLKHSVKTRHVLAALVVATTSYTGGANAAEADTRLLKFGGSCYRMPVWNTQWFNSSKDPERSISLRFENPGVERAVPGYRAQKTASGMPDDSFIVIFFKPAPSEAAQFEANRQQRLLLVCSKTTFCYVARLSRMCQRN
jgi:hypothetical protein